MTEAVPADDFSVSPSSLSFLIEQLEPSTEGYGSGRTQISISTQGSDRDFDECNRYFFEQQGTKTYGSDDPDNGGSRCRP